MHKIGKRGQSASGFHLLVPMFLYVIVALIFLFLFFTVKIAHGNEAILSERKLSIDGQVADPVNLMLSNMLDSNIIGYKNELGTGVDKEWDYIHSMYEGVYAGQAGKYLTKMHLLYFASFMDDWSSSADDGFLILSQDVSLDKDYLLLHMHSPLGRLVECVDKWRVPAKEGFEDTRCYQPLQECGITSSFSIMDCVDRKLSVSEIVIGSDRIVLLHRLERGMNLDWLLGNDLYDYCSLHIDECSVDPNFNPGTLEYDDGWDRLASEKLEREGK